jgi:hypothetical protein
MKKSIILLSSILLFWACKENLENTPACNPKAILSIEKHLVGKWNTVGSIDVNVGYKSVMEFRNDGTVITPTQFLKYGFFANGLTFDSFKFQRHPQVNWIIFKGYSKTNGEGDFDYQPDYDIACDRVNLLSSDGRLTLYKDNYKIPALCGADTSKGNVETWLLGKWNYSIQQEPNFEPNIIRTPKGIVEFKDDFTVSDSNPFGIVDAVSAYQKQYLKTKPTKLIWFKIGGNEKDLFFMFVSQETNQYYADNGQGICALQSVSCDKIVFYTTPGHLVTLNRVK